MSRKKTNQVIVKRVMPKRSGRDGFDHVLGLIDAARGRAFADVNTALIDLYWAIGEHISPKIAREGWGKGTVAELAKIH